MTENTSDYKKEYYKDKKKNSKLMIFLTLVLIFGIISIFVIYDGARLLGITGNSIKTPNEKTSLPILLKTNIPELRLDLENANFSINIFSGINFVLDEKIISLNKPQNLISFEGFSGKLELNNETIVLLSGKASRIILGGSPVTSKDNSKIKIYLANSETKYDSIKIESSAYLKELSFVGSGTIGLKENSFKLFKSEVVLKNLFGKFSIEKEHLLFDGIVTKLNIYEKDKKLSISK